MKTIQFLFMAFLIWLMTNAFAAVIYCIISVLGFEFDPFLCDECFGTLSVVLLFGLIFSAPFAIFLPIIFIIVERTETIPARRLTGFMLIAGLCLVVIAAFISYFGTDKYALPTVVTFLLPYIFGAIGSFALIGRRLIFDNSETGSSY